MKNLLFVMILMLFISTCSFAQDPRNIREQIIQAPTMRGPVLLSTEGTFINRDGWVMYCGFDKQEFYRWRRTDDEIRQCESYWKSINR